MDDINYKPSKIGGWLLGLPHFDSKSWDWWVPVTEMPQFFTVWLHAIGKQMVYRLCPWNVLYGKSHSCRQSGHVLVNFPMPFHVGQVPLDFWLATATSDKFLGFPNCGLFSKGLLPASSQDVKTTRSDQHLLFNNTSLVCDYSSSSTVFWSQLMGVISWCLPENMVPPKSIGYIITINIGHWWKPIFRQAPIGFMTILSMLFLLIACPLQAISGFRRWRSFPFKVTTRSFAVSRVFRIAVWS